MSMVNHQEGSAMSFRVVKCGGSYSLSNVTYAPVISSLVTFL